MPVPSRLRVSALALLLPAVGIAACTARQELAAEGMRTTVEGQVESIDRAPWAYDGNAVMMLRTADGQARVEIPARLNLCDARGLEVFTALGAGDRVRATGQANAEGHVSVCSGPDHALELLGRR